MSKERKSFLPQPKDAKNAEWLWKNDGFQKLYPALFELLACGIWEGGPRRTATLTFFVGEGRLKASLCDRQTGLTLFMTLEANQEPFSEVERLLEDGAGEWREPPKKGEAKTAPF